jgi:hypothetical protein
LAISPPDFIHHEEQDEEQGNIYGPQVFISKEIELTTFLWLIPGKKNLIKIKRRAK